MKDQEFDASHRSDDRPRALARFLLTGFVVMTCLRVWLGPWESATTAQAQIPDSGLQRKQAIDEARRTNELLAEIKSILQHEVLNVRVESADNPSGSPIKPPGKGK
jgi:hypothetical protein